MMPRRTRIQTTFFAVVASIAAAQATVLPASAQTVPFFERTTTAGNVELTVTNYGRFGNDFRSRASSFVYPARSGHEHMTRGGLWIGGLIENDEGGVDTLVTTSVLDAYEGSSLGAGAEFTPRVDPSWPPLTYIRERSALPNHPSWDAEALADQELLAVFDDAVPIGNQGDADPHVPLGVHVKQDVLVWGFEPFDAIVFVNYEITNLDPSRDIQDVYVAFYSELATGDKDATTRWPPGGQWYGAKDIGFVDSLRLVTERRVVHDDIFAPSWCGVQMLGASPGEIEDRSFTFRWWDWNPSSNSRDTDMERYELLRGGTIDSTNANEAASGQDPAVLLSVGPFGTLGANQANSIKVSVAFVGGANFADLVENGNHALGAYRKGFRIPVPPPPPRYLLQPGPHEITIRWENSPELAIDPETDSQDFEGYRIYMSRSGVSDEFELLKEADIVDEYEFPPDDSQEDIRFNTGLGSLIADDPVTIVDGEDTLTYMYKYVVRNVRDGFTYWTAITAFDRGALEIGPLESGLGLTRKMTIPGSTPSIGVGADSKVGVFPNPYRGDAAWDGELPRDRYLWFTNLPRRCKIRIYTLAGDIVDTIDFDGEDYDARDVRGIYDPTDPLHPELDLPVLPGGIAAWDLITENDQAVATGLYLFSVEDLDTGNKDLGQFVVIK